MPIRMKHWLALVAVWLVLDAIWLLPPRPYSLTAPPAQNQAVVRYNALKREARRTADVLQRVRWSGSLPQRLVASGRKVVVQADDDILGPATLEQVRGRFQEELDAVGSRRDDVLLGLYIVRRDEAGAEGLPADGRIILDTFVGSVDGHPYCLRVLSAGGSGASVGRYVESVLRFRSTRLLQSCRIVAAHGLPGPHIRAWLEHGAVAFTARAGEGIESRRETWSWQYQPRYPLGLRLSSVGRSSLDAERCTAGIAAGCASVFLNPGASIRDPSGFLWLAEHSPALSVGETGFSSTLGILDDYLLGDLEAQFGRDAFQRFWSSDAPVDEAFRSAFGQTPGDWMVDWVSRNIPLARPGPAIPRRAGVGSMLTLTLCALIVGLVARRRSVV